ncbi:T9SS type A sorting domain-containing protein [Christiangramia sp. SM2212]|uniref:T9SS type A sorting domain-containing protein n=1 Tax=Christiangramia sediminicola TaxID=3073267 RepID=A0ABU1EMF2_9FLAO|nr:T9SS type A sorting domain-containing protein [Christiangramia sp. SM2212]MDR5589565.1 T9SS type A sorting domain-containing protein [Christiangramia sp. SM2212]
MGKKLHGKFLLILLLFPAFIWGQDCPTSVSLSSDTGSSICAGTTATFTANPNSGTGPFIYEWKINSTVQTESSDTFVTSGLTNGQTVSVTVVSANGTSCSVSNSGSPITVNENKTPSVNFTVPTGTKCIDQNITFTASNTNGGSNPNYEWFVEGTSVQNSTNNKLIRSFPSEGSFNVRVVVTSNLTCVTSQTAEVTKQVSITNNASISVSDPDIDNACINSAISPIAFSIAGSATGANATGLPPGISGSYSNGTFTITGSPTSSGTFNYTVNTTGPCTAASSGGTITVLKDATISLASANNNQEVCQGSAISNINYTLGETADNVSVSGLPAGITGNLSGSTFSISGSSTSIGTHNFTLYATGSCGNSETLSGSIVIIENLTPTISIFSSEVDNEICAGEEVTFTINATNEGYSPSFQWKINGSNVAGENGTVFTTTNLENGDAVSIELTSSENCLTQSSVTSNEITTIVNENLTPEVTIEVTDTDICPGDEIIFSVASILNEGSSPGYQWKLDGSDVGNGSTYVTSNLEDGQTVSLVLTSNETCLAENDVTSNEITIEVYPPVPAVPGTISGEIEVCSTATGLTYSVTPVENATSYSWTLPNGWSMNPANQTSNSITVNAGGSGTGIISVLANNNCGDSSTASTLEVTTVDGVPANPGTITSDLGGNNNICPPFNINFSVAGTGSFKWTVPSGWDIISGAGTNAVTVRITDAAASGTHEVSVVANNICGDSSPSTYTGIVVDNHIVADFGEDKTICGSQNSIQLTGSRSFGDATLDVQFTSSSSGTSGFSNSTVGGQNKTGPFTVTYTPTQTDRNNGQVTLTMTVPEPKGNSNNGNKCGISSDSMVLYIIKDATISDPANKTQTVCINQPIENIEFTIGEAGTGGTVTGLPAGLNGVFNNGIFTISGTPTTSGSFNYTVNTTGDCTSQQVSRSGTITISPDNTITDATNKNQTVCINQPIVEMSFPVNSTVSSVSITGMPAGITGTVTGENFVITGTPTESGTFNYTLNTTGSCETASTAGSLTVNPDVTINDPSNKDQEICINTAIVDIEFEISSPGSGATVSNLPDGIQSEFSNGFFRIYGTPTVAGEFEYEVNTTGSCVQTSQSGIITVFEDPTAEISYDGPFCTSQGESSTVTLTGTGDYQNGEFSVSPAGLTIDSSSGAITAGGTTTAGTYTITYTGPDTCNRAVATTEVTINAAPIVELSYEGPFCNSDSSLKDPIFSNGVGNYTGGTFSAEPGGLTIDPNTGQINPQSVSPGTYDIFYEINDNASGCEIVIITTKVTITQNPTLEISYPEIICSSETSVAVVISEEDGAYDTGTFSGSNGLDISTDGTINPNNSTYEQHTVTYTIPAENGCGIIEKTATFTIKEQPVITTNPVNTGVCSNSPAEFEVIATGSDLKYQWYKIVSGTAQSIPGETDATLSFSNVTSADALDYYVIVSGSDTCSEVTSDTVSLNVDEDIVITEPSEDITICEQEVEEISFEFIGHANGSALTFKWMKNGVEVTEIEDKIAISQSGPTGDNGEYTGTLTIVNPTSGDSGDSGDYYVVVDGPDYFTCSEATSKTFTFRVEARPPKPETTDLIFCLNEEAGTLSADGESGNEIRWYTYDTNTEIYTYIGSDSDINIDTSTPANYTYYATQVRENGSGCESDYEPIQINVLNKPAKISEETITYEYCFGEVVEDAISVTPADGATVNWYATQEGTETISAPQPQTNNASNQTYWVSQTLTSTGCESDRTPVEIIINELPNVQVATSDGETTICKGSTVTLNLSGAESYTVYLGELEIANTTNSTVDLNPTTIGENIYTIEGFNAKGCSNTYNISIFVDELSEAGTLTPDNAEICVSPGAVTLSLGEYTGEIIKWEYKNTSTSDVWTEPANVNLSAERTFNNLKEDTDFRVTVKNGVCFEDYAETSIKVWQLPVGGELEWDTNNDRIFLTCENPADGFASSVTLSGHTGEIQYWEYRNAPSTTWEKLNVQTTSLSGQQVEDVINNLSTAFRAVISNGSCTNVVYSETAITSVIVADIKPTPVQVDKEVICIGDVISLSSETGYSTEGGNLEGGAFDNAGIKNNGWKFTNLEGGTNDFDSGANNGRADHWLRMNPHGQGSEDNEKVYTAHLDPINEQSPTNGYMVNFDTYEAPEGNKGFAIVTGDNDSYMETAVFSLSGLDEAILTFDQAYNLTEGARIIVEISSDGGATYNTVLQDITGTATSGNYDNFGDFTPEERPLNKMVFDLGDFLGLPNLRVRFHFDGMIDGDVWAVDNIEIPQGPQDVLLQWYYDEDLNDPDNSLETIGEVNQGTVPFEPRKIGWNDFEVQTRLILDSNGNACQSIDNFETIRVWAFDRYTSTVASEVGACGSLSVKLTATVDATYQAKTITEYPTLDGYVGSWKVEDLNGNEVTSGFTITNQDNTTGLEPVNDPNAIFTADELGDYRFKWILTPTAKDENDVLIDNFGCPPVENPSNVELVDCVTLDFDGDDDYVDLGQAEYTGSYFIEAWIMPFDRPIDGGGTTNATTGTIISGPGFEIKMEDLPATVIPNTRWYHIAVSNSGNIWVDGVAAPEKASGNGGTRTLIGARWNTTNKSTENHFSGWIDEVRIWNNTPELREVRFMMNQRIKLNGTSATDPIEGEVVPNLTVAGSYLTKDGHNMHLEDDGNLKKFYDQKWGDLAGYYRLYSNNPDPDAIPCFIIDENLKPSGGYTPDHSLNPVDGRMVNITTDQENTSPTPYCSGADATWANVNTWARPDVWDYPNSTSGGTAIEWNIAKVNHNITSDSKTITMLGLLSETENKLLSINGNHPITVTHYLLLDGNMDLVDDSQLLQDHGSILANSSKGWAEIDQEGRRSSFNYNYWTSPHSNQGSDNNSGFMINQVLMDGTTPGTPKAINFANGYFVADGARTNPITISNEWIWDFRGGRNDDYSDWLHLGSDYTEIVGAGYSMKGTDGTASLSAKQNYVFRGKPNNGNIPTADLNILSGRDFLVGNPYPSAIDANAFIKDNLTQIGNITGNNENNENVFNGSIYYWDHFGGQTHILAEYIGGYATWNLSGGLKAISNDWRINATEDRPGDENTPQQYIPVAQGFFLSTVGGDAFGGDIIFKNTQRIFKTTNSDPSVFMQHEENIKGKVSSKKAPLSDDTRVKIRLKYESPKKYYRQILVTMDQNTTNGFDFGYDAPLIENNLEDMYWYFDKKGYVIQGVPDFEKEQVLPLAIKSKEGGEFTIKIDETENWPTGKELYLKDKVLDTIHDLLAADYISSTEQAGEINDRFEIIFFKEKAEIPDPDEIIDPDELPEIDGLVGISYSTFTKQVKISNFDMLDVSKVMIFDMGGKLIQEYDELPTQREILLGMRPVRSGIYIVKVFSENGISNKKVVIK